LRAREPRRTIDATRMGEPERIKTRTTETSLDADGLLRGREFPGTETTLDDAKALVVALRKLAGGVRRPLVMDISESKSVTRDARAYLAGEEMASTVSAIGLVVGSALSRALGSFYLTFNRPKVPVRLFGSPDEAAAWLRTTLVKT
jgi:hypothetical protein